MAKRRSNRRISKTTEAGREEAKGEGYEKPKPPKVRPGGAVATQRSAWGGLSPLIQHVVCVVFLLAVALGFFAAVTFGGKTLIGGDTVQWRGMAQSMIEYEEQTGREALWAPNAFGGMPGYMIDYPTATPQFDTVLSWLRGLGVWPVAHLFALFLGTYSLVYYLVREPLAATLGAVAFGLTTYIPLILLAGHNSKFIALAFAPWLLLAYAYAVRRPPDATWGRTLLGGLLFAIALALNLRAGHVQITYYVAFAIAVAWVVEGVWAVREGQGRDFVISTAALAFGSVLALLMVAQPYLIQAEYKAFTIRAAGESGGLGWEYAMRWSQGWGELVTLLIPGAYGGGGSTYWGAKPFTAGPHYIGPTVLILAGLGLYGVRRRLVWGLGIAAGLMVLFSLGEYFPILNRPMFAFFPLFNAFRVPETWLVAVALALAVLAGFGSYYVARREVTAESEEAKTRAVYVGLGVTGGLVLLLLVMHGVFFSFEKPDELAQLRQAVASQAGVAPSDPRVASYASQALAEVKAEREDLFAGDAMRALMFLLAAGALLVLQRRRKIPAWALQVGLLLLVLIDLWQVGRRYFNADDPALRDRGEVATQIPEYDFDRFIQARVEVAGGPGHFRTLPLALNAFNDGRTPYFYESVGGYHGAKLALFQDYVDHILVNPNGTLNENGLDLLSARYVIARQPAPGLEQVFQDQQTGVLVLENPDALPRAFFVGQTEVVEGRDATFERLRDPSFDPRTTALLPEPLPDGFEVAPIDSASTTSVELVRFSPREIVWHAETDEPRLFVVNEVYYPAGWHVLIGNEPAPILRVDHLLRAVPVPAGRHIITMRFDPPRHALGVRISQLSTALVYLGALLIAGLMWYRRGEH
jgi:hypothetical protein